LADNDIRIRNTAFHFTKSFDRIFILETAGFLWTLFFHMCLVFSSSVRSLACNDTFENKRNSVFKFLFQIPSTVSCSSITNTKISLTSLHLQDTFTFKQRSHIRQPLICSLGRHLYKQCRRMKLPPIFDWNVPI
jgi:hypothetical protein